MATSPPPYDSTILFIYSFRDQNPALQIYQLLKYEYLPVWTPTIDIPPGGGWGSTMPFAVSKADPLLLVTSSNYPLEDYETLERAISDEKDIVAILLDDGPFDRQKDMAKVFRFSPTYDKYSFSELVSYLRKRQPDYEKVKFHDSGLKEILSAEEILNNLHANLHNAIHYYFRALQDQSPEIRSRAIHGLAELNAQQEVIFAASIRDPSPLVRSQAASVLGHLRTTATIDASGHIFISYARSDAEEFALNLAKRLRAERFKVWIDEDINPGSPIWIREIEKAIQASSLCLFIVSPGTHVSEWMPKEYIFANDFGKSVIPVLYKSTYMPLYLNTIQSIRDNRPFEQDPEQKFTALVDYLKTALNT
jgi:hypothetical protein